MTSDRRIVFDTSVAVSAALLPRSVPRQAFDLALEQDTVLVSLATIAELDEVLRRPKFDRYIAEERRLEFLGALVREAEAISVTESIAECRDAKDNKFLELGVCGRATHIISGDADLLTMHPFRGIAILTSQAFVQLRR